MLAGRFLFLFELLHSKKRLLNGGAVMVLFRADVGKNERVERFYFKNDTEAWFAVHQMLEDGEPIHRRGKDEKGPWVEVVRW